MKKFKSMIAILLSFSMLFAFAACGKDDVQAGNENLSQGNVSDVDQPNNLVDALEESNDNTTMFTTGGGTMTTEQVDNLVVVIAGNSYTIAPFGPDSGARKNTCAALYGSLICLPYMGASLEDCEYDLAKSVTKIDELTYEVELYDYIHDSKGNPITSEDIVFSYEKMREINNPTSVSTALEEIIVKDDYNMTFKLKTSGAGVVESVLGSPRICIVDKGWYEGASEDERTYDIATTGSYRVKNYVMNTELTVEALDDYWQTDPNLICTTKLQNVKTITYKSVKEPDMRSISLENEECDIVELDAPNVPLFMDMKTGVPYDGYAASLRGHPGFYAVKLNMDEHSVLSENENLRMAILCAINAEEIATALGYNQHDYDACTSFGTAVMGGYSDSLSWGEDFYPVDKAEEYFAASGYEKGGITLTLASKKYSDMSPLNMVVAQLTALGINVETKFVDTATAGTLQYEPDQWDIFYTNYRSEGYFVDVLNQLFAPEKYTGDVVNGCFYDDGGKLAGLLATAGETSTEADLKALCDYLYDVACFKPVYAENQFLVGREGIMHVAYTSALDLLMNASQFSTDWTSIAD